MTPWPDKRSRKLTGASGLHPYLAFASLSLRLFPARNRQQPAVASNINTANVITTPSMILVFFEVDFELAVAELELFVEEDGRAEALGRGRDGLGKRELKGSFAGAVTVNDCRPNIAGSPDSM